MEYPLISIIMPVYNLEHYVDNSINSVIHQNFQDFELLIIDDGSTDRTGKICDDYQARHNKIKVYHSCNNGVSSARNIGLNHARGRFIMFIDGDDVYTPSALKLLYGDIISGSDIILACAGMSRIKSYEVKEQIFSEKNICYTSKETIPKLLRGEFDVSACGKLFIKEGIGNLRFVEGKVTNEDKYFLFNYLTQNQGVVSLRKDILYGYYSRQGSTCNSAFDKKNLDKLYFSDAIIKEVKDIYPEYIEDAEYHDFVRRLEVIKNIIRSHKLRAELEVYREVKSELFKRYSHRHKDFYNSYRLEYLILSSSDLLYYICVVLFDLKNKIKN